MWWLHRLAVVLSSSVSPSLWQHRSFLLGKGWWGQRDQWYLQEKKQVNASLFLHSSDQEIIQQLDLRINGLCTQTKIKTVYKQVDLTNPGFSKDRLLSKMKSAPALCTMASLRILSQGTITPRSITLKVKDGKIYRNMPYMLGPAQGLFLLKILLATIACLRVKLCKESTWIITDAI